MKKKRNYKPPVEYLFTDAKFSNDKKYRYELHRVWDEEKPRLVFIGLNPSTATVEEDDPTIIKCVKYAMNWGYGSIVMLNLFAYRATDPSEMLRQESPVGEFNDQTIKKWLDDVNNIIVCWSDVGGHRGRDKEVQAFLNGKGRALKLCKSGRPCHPLYLSSSILESQLVLLDRLEM